MDRPVISFIICSWKAPASLEETLVSISTQKARESFETLIVNNGFSESRAEELRTRFPDLNLRIPREPQLGLACARKRGFLEARGDIFVLLDDDNSLEGEFVEPLLRLTEEHPDWGVVRPAVLPRWETPPPAWLESFGQLCLSYTSPRLRGSATRYWPCREFGQAQRPPGGGMILHREVAQAYLASLSDDGRLRLGRTGGNLMGSEDADIFRFVEKQGRGLIETEELVVYHHIPKERLRLPYMLRLNYAMLKSYAFLEVLSGENGKFRTCAEVLKFGRQLLGLFMECVTGRKTLPHAMCLAARQAGWISGHLQSIRS